MDDDCAYAAFWSSDSGMEIESYLEKRKAHFCDEWDGLFIDKDDPEFECCLCFKE